MIRLISSLLLLFTVLVSMLCNAGQGLSGIWQHESEPVWIDMKPDQSKGFVIRNENKPEREGLLAVRDLVPSNELNKWSAEVYAARLGEYRKAAIKLIDDDRLSFIVKVGFIRQSVNWNRVSEVLPASDDK